MPVKDYSKPENLQKILDEYTKFQELKLGSSKRLADMIGLFKDINYTDSSGERRKFGLEQVIMAATNDGFYKNEKGVEAIALADAELDNYRRGIFLPDDINDNDNFVKMLTDKGVPLSIFGKLAEINKTYYDRGNEGLVKMARGGSITDMLPTVNVVAPPIARGSFNLPSLEELREKELVMGRGVKETEVEPTVTPVEIAPVLPNVIPEVEDRSRTAPLPPEKPKSVPSNKNIIKNKLLKQYSPEAVAGIMGSIAVETGNSFRYDQKQKGGGPGRGLFQMEGKMLEAYREYLKNTDSVNSLNSQIDFVSSALLDNSIYDIGAGHRKKLKEAFESGNVEKITTEFSKRFLRPGKPHLKRRLKEARKIKKELK